MSYRLGRAFTEVHRACNYGNLKYLKSVLKQPPGPATYAGDFNDAAAACFISIEFRLGTDFMP